LDWRYVLETAELHGLLPLLRAQLEKLPPNTLRLQVGSELDRACRANAAHNLALTGELLSLLRLLEDQEIAALPFKGPALAEQIFGNVAMRQFSISIFWFARSA